MEAASKMIKALPNLGKVVTKPIRALIKLGKATLSRSLSQPDQSFISLHMKSLQSQLQFTTNTGFRLLFKRNHAFPATDNCPAHVLCYIEPDISNLTGNDLLAEAKIYYKRFVYTGTFFFFKRP